MEKHRCKLCFKNFSNGRALGGHMRSHMLNLPISVKDQDTERETERDLQRPSRLSVETESDSYPFSEDEDEEKGVCYGLRENPKRSFRIVDPEFSFAQTVDAGSIVLQDRESETESSKNPTRRRSKRTRNHQNHQTNQFHHYPEKKIIKLQTQSYSLEQPVSSISDTTTEEDVAFCLMMLSRDENWKQRKINKKQCVQTKHTIFSCYSDEEAEAEEEDYEDEETDESESYKNNNNHSNNKTRTGKYKCDTCNKVFKSYQALGGHRASHKKVKFQKETAITDQTQLNQHEHNKNAGTVNGSNRVHECPVCFRVFSSGQALGGHKRTHVTGLVTSSSTINHGNNNTSSIPIPASLIDLNLPAPVEEDEMSQIELSAVSDSEFVNNFRR